MAFTVADFEDLYRLLSEHPEWRARLRPLILGDEIVELPQRLAEMGERLGELVTAVNATNLRLDRVDGRLEHMDSRFDGVDSRFDGVDSRFDGVDSRFDGVDRRFDGIDGRLEVIDGRLGRLDGRAGNVEGHLLELKYAGNLRNWLGKYLWPVELVAVDDLALLSEAVRDGRLKAEDVDRLRDLDLLAKGNSRQDPAQVTLLAGEVSQTINVEDVERAADRASTLRQAGYPTIAFVGGNRLGKGAQERAAALTVTVDLRRSAA